jgi:uncharacterized membrane protein (UPF0127 family)
MKTSNNITNLRLIQVLLLLLSTFVAACQSSPTKPQCLFETIRGEKIKLRLALTAEEQTQGLSGVRVEQFSIEEGMLFRGERDQLKTFWMPDTYFDQHIFFLDQNFKILDVARNVPHYIGRENETDIPRVKPVYARHVFEMRADSKIATQLQTGENLKWICPQPLEQILPSTHPQQ